MTGQTSSDDVFACLFLSIGLYAGGWAVLLPLIDAEHLTPRWLRQSAVVELGAVRVRRARERLELTVQEACDRARIAAVDALLGACAPPQLSERSHPMNRIRLAIHRLFRRPSIAGPMRFHTRRLPDGVLLDLEDYFLHVVTTITDDPDALALLMEIVEDRSLSREHDGWTPEKLSMERLIEMVGHEIPVSGQALARLADRLRAAAPAAPVAAVPSQRREGRAA